MPTKTLEFLCPKCQSILNVDDEVYVDDWETDIEFQIQSCKHCCDDKPDTKKLRKTTVEKWACTTLLLTVRYDYKEGEKQ